MVECKTQDRRVAGSRNCPDMNETLLTDTKHQHKQAYKTTHLKARSSHKTSAMDLFYLQNRHQCSCVGIRFALVVSDDL